MGTLQRNTSHSSKNSWSVQVPRWVLAAPAIICPFPTANANQHPRSRLLGQGGDCCVLLVPDGVKDRRQRTAHGLGLQDAAGWAVGWLGAWRLGAHRAACHVTCHGLGAPPRLLVPSHPPSFPLSHPTERLPLTLPWVLEDKEAFIFYVHDTYNLCLVKRGVEGVAAPPGWAHLHRPPPAADDASGDTIPPPHLFDAHDTRG